MKRATHYGLVFLAGVTLGAAIVRASNTNYTVKVTDTNEAEHVIVAKFVVVPEDLRIVCHGDWGKEFVGDYVKISYKEGNFYIGKALCKEMRWMR